MANETESMDIELPDKMASLDLALETPAIINSPKSTHGRTLRLRNASKDLRSNRRVLMKPQRKPQKIKLSEEEIRKLYSNQTLDKHSPRTLETIFEEPKLVNDNTTLFIGLKKIRRSISFPIGPTHSKEKIKKRRSRIKRLLGSKSRPKKKVTMETFLSYLKQIDSDEEAEQPIAGDIKLAN